MVLRIASNQQQFTLREKSRICRVCNLYNLGWVLSKKNNTNYEYKIARAPPGVRTGPMQMEGPKVSIPFAVL